MNQLSACGRWNIFSTLDKEDFCMKSAKKILALILAGVMALALLTVCVKAKRNISVAVKRATDSWLKISYVIKMPYRLAV